MNSETKSRFRIGSKIASVALSAALIVTSFTGLGSTLVSTEVEAASTNSYGLVDNIQDGNILHCFCWKYTDITAMLPEIAEAGFTSVQTSPPQATSGTGAWWWFYQPKGFYIGTSELGSKEELRQLCTEADKYGIKVIADVVANHLAGDHSVIQDDLKDSQFWHDDIGNADDGDRYRVTHGKIGMPDLNTEHSYVQQCVKNYIQELKEVGIDGIRFDAAKHIALPSEGDQFWPTVTSDSSLWYYGEILNNPGLSLDEGNSQRPQAINVMKEYSNYIGITDSRYGMTLREDFNKGQAPTSFGCYCGKWMGIPATRLVYWGESHDTWSNNQEWGYSNHMSQNVIDRAYAIAASRDHITALYFSRPSSAVKDDIKIGAKGSTHFTSKEVAAVNHFKNAMNGQPDYFTSGSNCSVVCRQKGAVVVAGSGGNMDVTVPNGGSTVTPGTYTDEITGSTWTVTTTTISGRIGDSGIAVVYNPEDVSKDPKVTASPANGTPFENTLTVTLTATNCTTASYTTSEGDSGTFTTTKTITVGGSTAVGGTVTINVSGTGEGGKTYSGTYTYTKKDPNAKVKVYFDNSGYNWSKVVAYVYNGDGDSAVPMAKWPGTEMTKGPKYYELDVTGFESGRVIFSDGADNTSNRYPSNMDPGLQIGGTSMLFSSGNSWKPYVEESSLKVSLSATPTSVTVGSPVTLTASATGASGTVKYAFTTGSTTIQAAGTSNTATWTPTAEGDYTITVTATDSSGSSTATANVKVTKQESNDPTVTSSVASGTSFTTETFDITLSLSNATEGTYSVDDGPVKKFSGTQKVTIGQGKIGDSTVTVKATATDGTTTKNYSFTYEKKYVVKSTSSSASLTSYYSTNANGKGVNKTISVDGDISDWDSSMLIAQGTANDDPRVYRPNSMYEVPIDLYALYAAYDDTNLYLMWEMTNVQEIVAPIDDYPISQGTLWQTQELPFFILVDTGKSADAIGNNGKLQTGGTIWNSGLTTTSSFNRLISINTKGGNGPFVYGGDSTGLNKVEMLDATTSNIKMKFGMGVLSQNIYGIKGAYGVNNGRVIGDMCNAGADWVDFRTLGHDSTAHDFFYELSIPLSELGVTKADVQSTGLGVLLVATSGKSGMDCLPYDLSMNDNADLDDAAGSQENNSFEKSDEDNVTCTFARVGNGDVPPPPPPPSTPLQVNFGADRSAPQYTSTDLTLKGIGYGGTAPYSYTFYVDDTVVKAKSTTDTYSWTTPSTAGTYEIKCVITDSTGATATVTKNYTVEKSGSVVVDDLKNNSSISATSITAGGTVKVTNSASGGTSPYTYYVAYKNSTDSSYTTVQNYTTTSSVSFKLSTAGTYTVVSKVKDSAGTIVRATFTVTVSGPSPTTLTNNSTISATSVTTGTAVKVTNKASGGTSPYAYYVSYKNSTDSSYTTVQNYTTTSSASFTPKAAGTYTVVSKVKDGTGTIAKTTFTVTVTAPATELSNDTVLSATKLSLGTSLVVTGKASGGTAPYQYAVFYKKTSDSAYTTAQASSTNSKVTIKFTEPTVYDVRSKVKDSTGKAVIVDFIVTVTAGLTNNSKMSATSVALGNSVTLTGAATGGTSPYTYAFYYKKSTDSSYTTLSGFSTTKTATLKPTTSGTYTVVIKVKDKAGTVERKEFTLTVTKALTNSSKMSATSVALGNSVTLTGAATGGTSPYTYAFYYKKSTDSSYTTLQGFSTTKTATLKPTTSGSYTVVIKVKDKTGTTARKEFTLTVTKALKNSSKMSATTVALGNSVTLTGAATGGTSPYTYAFYYKKSTDSSYTTLSGFSTTKTATLKPTTSGSYTVVIKVKDNAGTVARKEFTLTVTKALTNSSKMSATSITLGDTVTLTGAATGGTSPYQYAFYYKKSTDSSYTTLQAFSTTKTATLKPTAKGTYDVVIKVMDSTNTVVRSQFSLTVKAATSTTLVNNSKLSATSITLGKSVTLTGAASGGTSPYQYAFYYKKSTDSSYTTLQAFSTTKTATLKPTARGTYDVVIKVMDSTNTVVRNQYSLTVT